MKIAISNARANIGYLVAVVVVAAVCVYSRAMA